METKENNGISTSLQESSYNLRERINIYAGAFIGAVAPVVVARYGIAGFRDSSTYVESILSWIAAAASVVFPFSVAGSALGTVYGFKLAAKIRRKREQRESAIEQLVR